MILWLAALFCTALVSWAIGYRRGYREATFAAMRAQIADTITRLSTEPKPKPPSNRLTADAIATALETARNASVYHDTESTGPLVASWCLERKH